MTRATRDIGQAKWEVPEYRITELEARRYKYALCVFVINEGHRLLAQLERMPPWADQVDVIVADGGSTDGSTEPVRLKNLEVRSLLTKIGPGKLSAQMRMAFAYALSQEYEGVVTIDGNNKDDPNAIPSFVGALDAGFDHIQGSRFIEGGAEINTPLIRFLGVKLIHAPLISLAAGFRYTDTTNGFRAYSRRLLSDPIVAPFRDVFIAYELHYYLAIRAAQLGYKVTEVPVTRAYPAKGRTPTKISPFKGNMLILMTLLNACLHRFDPPVNGSIQGVVQNE